MKVNKKFDKTEKNASKNQSIVNEKHVYDAYLVTVMVRRLLGDEL